MKKTMLTADTLTRFERLVNPDTLTAEQIKEIEHDAYCANMGAENHYKAWDRFVELVREYAGIDLDNISKPAKTLKTIGEIKQELETRNDRSARDKGVTAYALELLETLEENRSYNKLDENVHPLEVESELLNGATNWDEFSYGGSALIYDGDIAERLCCPSELKKTRNGERNPNSRETWLDVQARALRQACRRIKSAARF